LRLDPTRGAYFLLYPEKALRLNASAAEIVRACTGRSSVSAIVRRLARHYHASSRRLDVETRQVLSQLAERGLLRR
jgi:coenzyme PQQ biosynthesis protein PqqD